jgi:uncharacterized Zn finger protein (UPF0148 family)
MGASGRIMVSKKCVRCGAYFAGDLDGDYTCPRCQASGPPRLRPAEVESRPPRAPAPGPAGKSSSQAA